MMCLAKDAPRENLMSRDRSMQSLTCADECLADNVYLDIVTMWCQQSAGTYFILLKLNYL